MMKRRVLGKTGKTVSAVGLGTMGMTGGFGTAALYGPTDDRESIATIHRALDLGIDMLDTAEVYGPYHNERLVGRALAGRRDEAVIASKFGFRISEASGAIEGFDGTPENAKRALEASLARLGVEHIDLWYLHRLDRGVPIEETVGAMADAVTEGTVRWLGLSEVSVSTLRRACAVHPIAALQSEYSVWERNLEQELAPACRELGVSIVAYCPLGRGFLSGAVPSAQELDAGDYRRTDPRFSEQHHRQNRRIVKALEEVAARHGASAAQIAIAWLLHRSPDVIPIPGTKRQRYVEENAAAVDIALSPNDLSVLDTCGVAVGARYREQAMAAIDR